MPGKSHGWKSLVGCSPWGGKSRTPLSDFTFTFFRFQKKPNTELNKLEIGNLPNKEFKVRVTKMFTELRGRVNKNSKQFMKEL